MIKNPLAAARKIRRRTGDVKLIVEIKANDTRLPLGSVDVEVIRQTLWSLQAGPGLNTF
jgi:hypothetical protein